MSLYLHNAWRPSAEERVALRDVRLADLVAVQRGYGLEVWAEDGGSRLVVAASSVMTAETVLAHYCAGACLIETCVECAVSGFGQRDSVVAVAVVGRSCISMLLSKEKPVAETKETGTVAGLTGRASAALGEEIPTVAWMTAARQAIDRSGPRIGQVLVKAKAIRPETAKIVTTFVTSELGSGVYGFVVGTVLSAHPRAAKKPWLGMIAKHMRMEGLARIGAVLVDPLLAAVENVLLGAVEESGIDVKDVKAGGQ